jgi:hypothetical protein
VFVCLSLFGNLIGTILYTIRNVAADSPEHPSELLAKFRVAPDASAGVLMLGILAPEMLYYFTRTETERMSVGRLTVISNVIEDFPVLVLQIMFTVSHGWIPLMTVSLVVTSVTLAVRVPPDPAPRRASCRHGHSTPPFRGAITARPPHPGQAAALVDHPAHLPLRARGPQALLPRPLGRRRGLDVPQCRPVARGPELDHVALICRVRRQLWRRLPHFAARGPRAGCHPRIRWRERRVRPLHGDGGSRSAGCAHNLQHPSSPPSASSPVRPFLCTQSAL